jgi:hypothetical protein
MSSLLLRENVLALLAAPVLALLDQMLAALGASAAPDLTAGYLFGAAVVRSTVGTAP